MKRRSDEEISAPLYAFDAEVRSQYGCFAGVDEAGRGPLCGPVCVAACILDPENPVYGINDSKKLTEKKREALFDEICEKALAYRIIFVGPEVIDRENILNATMGGMQQAVEELDIVPNLVLVEGNIDVITLHQAGFDNVVATMGTALTEEHARILARYTKELVLCYDNDAAGKQSTDRVLNILKNANLNVRVLQLPNAYDAEGKPIKQDPDDFVKKFGPAAFEKCLNGSAGQNDYRLETLQQKHSLADEEGRMAFLREAVETVAALQSPIEREIYGNKAAAAAGISAGAFAQEVERFRKNRAWQARKKQARRELTPAAQLQPRERELRYENLRSARAEEGVVRLLLLEPDLFPQVEGLGPEQFSAPVLAKIYALLCQRHREGRSTQLAALAGALSPEEMSHLVSVMDQPEALAHSAQALRDYIEIIETEALKRGGAGASDPLLAAREKFRERKAYGG